MNDTVAKELLKEEGDTRETKYMIDHCSPSKLLGRHPHPNRFFQGRSNLQGKASVSRKDSMQYNIIGQIEFH